MAQRTPRTSLVGLVGLALLVLYARSGKAPMPSPATAGPEPAAVWNLPGKAPHLLAHYVDWFSTSARRGAPDRTWEHWRYDDRGPAHDPDQRLTNGLRDIASVVYPLIGPYSSGSRQVIRYHLATAKAAGIQGFIVDWYGRDSFTDRAIPLLLDEAQRLDMRIALCYEEKLNFQWRPFTKRAEAIENATKDLAYIVRRYGSHPAYMRRNGKPFIVQFDGWGESRIGPGLFQPEELASILAALPSPAAYCRQGIAPAYHPAVPGVHQWWSASAAELRWFGTTARNMIGEGKLAFFGGMISPGFDDTGVWGWGAGPRVTPREGLSLLRGTFDLCLTGDPEFVQIVTWNDFNEGTVVEPTRETGFQYLDAIATWWAARQGKTPDLDAIRRPFLTYARTCSAARRAELPPKPYDQYLAKRSLVVSVPRYLDVLDERPKAKR